MNDMELIYSYTTKQAVEDGLLVLIPADTSKEAGITFPVYLSKAVWDKYVEVPASMEGEQDVSGRLWDILWMFRMAARKVSGSYLEFEFICRLDDIGDWESNEVLFEGRFLRTVRLKAMIQAQDFDDPSPAIFILKPNED
jgi:hypothetical protein